MRPANAYDNTPDAREMLTCGKVYCKGRFWILVYFDISTVPSILRQCVLVYGRDCSASTDMSAALLVVHPCFQVCHVFCFKAACLGYGSSLQVFRQAYLSFRSATSSALRQRVSVMGRACKYSGRLTCLSLSGLPRLLL